MSLELELDVPESREVRFTLPPDVPTGRVRVTVAAVRPGVRPEFPPRPTHPKLAREHDAFEAMLPELMTRHADKYVAIHDGQVIAEGNSSVAVLSAAEESHPGAYPLVRFVTDQPQPPERLPSIRLARGGE